MSPTLQNTRAQRNAALARSSSSTGRVSPLVALSGHRLVQCKCLLLTQSGHRPLAHSSALAMVRRWWVLIPTFMPLRAIPSPKKFALKLRRQTPELRQ